MAKLPVTKTITEKRAAHADRAPSCPMDGCGANVMRPKCFWDLNPADCPRHAVRDAYLSKHPAPRKAR